MSLWAIRSWLESAGCADIMRDPIFSEEGEMKETILRGALFSITAAMFCLSYPAASQGVLDQGKSLLGGASKGGAAGIVQALPLDKIMELLKQQGYSNITGLGPTPSGDALQAKATNSSGSPVDLLVNPSTGQVLKALTK
jgi:hypothetical protein